MAALYETLFFNIRDRVDARDWIVVQAIGIWACDQTAQERNRPQSFRLLTASTT